MDLLARREHSKVELNNKLALRFGSDPNIPKAVEILSAENLQSDERFLKGYIYSRTSRLFGPLHIQNELRKRGISDDQIQIAFDDAQINWSSVCKTLSIKKFGPEPSTDIREKSRRFRFLVSRGFRSEDMDI